MTLTERGRLLLDYLTVHGPLIETSCKLLRQKAYRSDEFQRCIHPSHQESELLPFLLDSGLVESTRGGIRLSRTYRPDWSPQLNLMRLLHGRSDVNRTFRFIWEALLYRPEWADRLLNRDDLWPTVNQTRPEGASLPVLNSNRMASWLRIASWIGLVQPERSNTVVLLPTFSLLAELLDATLPRDGEVSLEAWTADVEAQFCRITSELGELHPGFASALSILEAVGQVRLYQYSDAKVMCVGTKRASHLQWKGRMSA